MMYALRPQSRERIRAAKGACGICPGCRSPLLAKCGVIVAHHWSHLANGVDCDAWSEGESDWHMSWKAKAPVAWCEVTMGPHRADIRRPDGLVIELQHSPIDPATIEERERFYGRMIWVIDLRDKQHHIELQDEHEDGSHRFAWEHPRRSWTRSERPKFLDLGDRILEILNLDEDGAHGLGRVHSVDDFLRRAKLSPMTAAERAAPVRYEVVHANDGVECLRGRPYSERRTVYDRAEACALLRRELEPQGYWPEVSVSAKDRRWSAVAAHVRSLDFHATAVTVIARSGRRKTRRYRHGWIGVSGQSLVLRYATGWSTPLYTATIDRPVLPDDTPTVVQVYRPQVCHETRTARGLQLALPMAKAWSPIVGPVCPPPPPPKQMQVFAPGDPWSVATHEGGRFGVHETRPYDAQDFRDWLANKPRAPLVNPIPHLVFDDPLKAFGWLRTAVAKASAQKKETVR